MPQTMAFVSLEKSGFWEVAFRRQSLPTAVPPSIAQSAAVESSLFYNKKMCQPGISLRSKRNNAEKALKSLPMKIVVRN